MKIQKNRAIYIGLLIIVWACAYVYIFNEKIDINGDNCRYYTFASSLASGQGYADISAPHPSPHQCLSPGISFIDDPAKIFYRQHHSSKNTQRAFPFRRSFVTVLFYDQTQNTRKPCTSRSLRRHSERSGTSLLHDDDERDVLLFRFNRGHFPLSEYEERKAIL